ncbi:MAG: sugar-binding domain-containing protein [Planctomycetota bacterium]
MKTPAAIVVLAYGFLAAACCAADWKPAGGPLLTRWAKEVSPENVHPEYPRPQMVRQQWLHLNGLWDYAILPADAEEPDRFDGQILVPFAAESALSGVMKPVGKENRLWYRRTVRVPAEWSGQRVLLHFEGVDWETTVWLNGHQVGMHRGGYDPFTFDVTKALSESGPQEIVVSVWDPINEGTQPRGKQVKEPGGIWYTSVTGIWRTVWMEPVPAASIAGLDMVPDVDAGVLRLTVETSGAKGSETIRAEAVDGGTTVATADVPVGRTVEIKLAEPKLWSPDSPFLYDVKVSLIRDGNVTDEVESYFGMRKIALDKDASGIVRMMLNGEFVFQHGPLDQGWWPDGLYTAPTDDALRYDLEVLKEMGFNMLRKHVKVAPRRLYYWCDKLGLLVWQDMPNGDRHIGHNDPDIQRSPESAAQFELELRRVIDTLRNHPSIIMWVPFNEGWGQYDTARIVNLVKEHDPTRLVINTSGWADRGVGDVLDIHRYPGPAMPDPQPDRAIVLGEFGGLGLPLEGHLWKEKGSWGYRGYKTQKELTRAYLTLMTNLRPMVAGGLSAAVYTQTSDCEIEVNGLMTYDRAVVKLDPERLAEAHRRLSLPPPEVRPIVPTSREQPQAWRFTTTKPEEGWQNADFDDSSWQEGEGGFGTEGTPGAVVRTEWKTPDIWIRRVFDLGDSPLGQPHLEIHHDEDAAVYLNGRLVAEASGYTTDYTLLSLDDEAFSALKPGRNVLAVHCRQTGGGQYIDVGLVDVVELPMR